MTINRAALHVLLARAQNDLAAAQSAALIVAGDRLGFYRVLAVRGKTADALAAETGTDIRYVQSWLANQTAGGYVTRKGDEYTLTPEQAALFIDDSSAFFLPAAFELASALAPTAEQLAAAMRGRPSDPPEAAYRAVDRMAQSKVATMIEALPPATFDNVKDIVDIGCGSGAFVRALTTRYPHVRATGVDPRNSGAGDIASIAANSIDVAFCIETLHELEDPAGAVRSIARILRADGHLIVIEQPIAERDAETTTGRLFAATNVLFCLPASRSRGLGVLAGEEALRDVLRSGGFARIERIESPTFLILECRK